MASDHFRTSLFNALERAPWSTEFAGRRVLDLFAGAGAWGFEALRRGAAFVLFVETDPVQRGAIREIIETQSLFGVTRIHRRDATDMGAKPAGLSDPFDLVFVDPPDSALGTMALPRLREGGWITSDATIVFVGAGAEVLSGFTILDRHTDGAGEALFMRPA